nr:MAG: ORF2 [Bat faecal associated dicistrovirus 4]
MSKVVRSHQPLRKELLSNAEDGREHTIKDFLQRPIPLTNFEWSVSSAQFSTLYTAQFPDAILSQTLYSQKLAGFLGLRSDLELRLQVNAQPFQAGRLIMAWVPYYKYLGARVANFDNDTEGSMVSLTGCPRVEIDISQGTTATLCVPYSSPLSYYNLVTGEGNWGKLYIKVYSPLSDTAGSGQIDCTLWFNFKQPQLAFPTGVAMATSSVSPVAQVGAEESVAEKDRSFSNVSYKLGGLLRTIPHVLELQSITEPAAWASDRVGDILKFFGLSKIESSNVPNYIKQSPAKFLANCDGCNLSHSLSLLQGNAIELMPDMVPEAMDEMALASVYSTPNYYTHFSWSNTQTVGTELYLDNVHPTWYFVSNTSDSTISPTHLMFTSAAFGFWRGSIVYTFKFIKTKFHSGRCRIYFQPGDTAFTTSNRNYNYSQVIDLRSEDVVNFSVPYVSTKPWMRVADKTAYNVPGVVHVEVLNDLKAASSVASSIDVLVEISAGSDFELAAPCAPIIQPVNTTTSPSAASRLLRAMAQVGEEVAREDEQSNIVNHDQLGQKVDFGNWMLNLAMHGEKCLSLRQLIKRSSNSATVTLSSSGSICIAPFSPQINYSRSTTGDRVTVPKSFLDYFAGLYSFWRGSVNLKIFSSSLISNRVNVEAVISFPTDSTGQETLPAQSTLVSTTIPVTNGYHSSPVQIILQDLEGCIDVTCPYYNSTHMSPVSDYTFNNTNCTLNMYPPYLVVISNLPAGTYTIFRAAADDYQLGYLLGAPKCEFVTSS